ncbi:MAG: hypothetical protein GY801_29705 [bacterium]|nr:hypothetical protein [bacterium]
MNAKSDGWLLSCIFKRSHLYPGTIDSEQEEDTSPLPEPSAIERVQRFYSIASPMARKLAGYLSAVPLTLHTMRLVQQVMLPESQQTDLAEVFLGGLLTQESGISDHPYLTIYDFHEGVREILFEMMLEPDFDQIWERISAFLEPRFGQSLDFQAWVADPNAAEDIVLDDNSLAFAKMSAKALKQFRKHRKPAKYLEQAVETLEQKKDIPKHDSEYITSQHPKEIQQQLESLKQQLRDLRNQYCDATPNTPEAKVIRERYKNLQARAKALQPKESVLLPLLEPPVAAFRHIQAGHEYFEEFKGNVHIDNVDIAELSSTTNTIDPVALCEAYLNALLAETRQISLAGIDMRVASADEENCHHLDAIYTELLTLNTESSRLDALSHQHEDAEEPASVLERYAHQRSALAQVNRYQHLVLLGESGSGKSTFVNFLTMCLTGASLGEEIPYLTLLTASLPNDKGNDRDERQPWQHSALLPVRVILKDFAARGFPADGEAITLKHLWQFLRSELYAIDPALEDLTPYLHQYFLEHGGMLILDGLDEVPEAERYRTQLKTLVETFARTYPRCRVLVVAPMPIKSRVGG